jgi:BirA family biotin operon repressor/biotin-[acetyl-CoA-carboxylase] ligase
MPYEGLSEAELARLLGVPLVVTHASVTSTLDLAHELGARGAAAGSVVLADIQTAGRGRHGRAWASPPGGVWLALLARPDDAPLGGALAVRVGLAARAAVEAAVPEAAPLLKWPNDIMVADRKAGGVLCEACWTGGALAWVAIGVGINVRGAAPEGLADRAISLEDVSPGVTRLGVLTALVPRVLAAGRAAAALSDEECTAFLASCWADGDGIPERVDPDGALVVRHPGGVMERRTAPA